MHYLVEFALVGVPAHDCFKQRLKKSSVANRLILRAGRQRIGDVREQPIVADDRAEVRRVQIVYDTNEIGTVECVDFAQQAPRKDTQLQELSDGLGLGFVT